MGLLKLGSIYKKKNKKESSVPPLPTKKEPVALGLGLNLNLKTSSSIRTSNQNINHTMPAGSGSLFDDIFAELGSKPVAAAPVELTGPKPAAKIAAKGKKNNNNNKTRPND